MKTITALVAVADYPSNKKLILYYVHTRDLFYKKNDIDVTVLNFSAIEEYSIDGIRVIPLSVYEKENVKYDVLICHAANIRNHYRFLKKYGDMFPKFVFFFHGHEVLKISKAYCKPYKWAKKSIGKTVLQNVYDDFKLAVWRKYYPTVAEKSRFIFVSNWMLDEFLKWTRIPYNDIRNSSCITYNCIGYRFEETQYVPFPTSKNFMPRFSLAILLTMSIEYLASSK